MLEMFYFLHRLEHNENGESQQLRDLLEGIMQQVETHRAAANANTTSGSAGDNAAANSTDNNAEGAEIKPEDVDDGVIGSPVAVVQNPLPVLVGEEEEEKHCWVCFASESDDPTAVWKHPCV